MIGDALEHGAQVRLRIHAVQFRRADQAVDARGTLAAGVRTTKEIVLPAKCHRPQRALGGVVIDFDTPIRDVARQRGPAREHIADRLGEFGFLRYPRQGLA